MAAPALQLPRWQELALRQDRVLSRRQGLLGGLSEDAWQWRLDLGSWQAVLPGVAVTHSGPVTERQRIWAAVLYAGTGAAVSGDAALMLNGFGGFDQLVVDVAIPVPRQVVAQPGLRIHRTTRLREALHPIRSPAQPRLPRAVLDSVAWAPSNRAAEWRAAAAVQQRLVTVTQLRTELGNLPQLRRRALVTAVLLDVERGAHAQTELDFLRLLRRNRLPAPDELQMRVRAGSTRYLDAAWHRQRVAVEIDGAHHRRVESWNADTLRANEIVVAARLDRLILLRFTGANLRHDEPAVVRQLRTALI